MLTVQPPAACRLYLTTCVIQQAVSRTETGRNVSVAPCLRPGVDRIKKSPAFLPGLLVVTFSWLNLVVCAEAFLKVLIAQAVNLLTVQVSEVEPVDA